MPGWAETVIDLPDQDLVMGLGNPRFNHHVDVAKLESQLFPLREVEVVVSNNGGVSPTPKEGSSSSSSSSFSAVTAARRSAGIKHHAFRGTRLTRHKNLFSVFEKVLYDHDALDVYHDRYLGGLRLPDAL